MADSRLGGLYVASAAEYGVTWVPDYTDRYGIRSEHRVQPRDVVYGMTDLHEGPQFMLYAWCPARDNFACFLLSNVHSISEG